MCLQPRHVLYTLPYLHLRSSCSSADLQGQTWQAVKDIFGQEVHKQHLLLTFIPTQLSAPAPSSPLLNFVLLHSACPTVYIANVLLHTCCNEHIMSVTQGKEEPKQSQACHCFCACCCYCRCHGPSCGCSHPGHHHQPQLCQDNC